MKNNINKSLSKLIILSAVLTGVIQGCNPFDTSEPYITRRLSVVPVFSEEVSSLEGISVNIGDINKGSIFDIVTDAEGRADIELPSGNYRIVVSHADGDYIFNGSADNVIVSGTDRKVTVKMTRSRKGEIVIKEIYCGGCSAYPQKGQYQSDKYVIVHNNSPEMQYLDNLCIGTLDPYNATGTNVWVETDKNTGETVFPDFVPIVQAVLKIGGDGSSFPLSPGDDAVICLCGAIDHTVTYPNSVNLNKPDCFVCYDPVMFPNTTFHPVPGPAVSRDRWLDVVIKTGQAKAYTLSLNSPTVVIYRAAGQAMEDFVMVEGNVIQKPGSPHDRVTKIPVDWILDGVEVFTGNTSGNIKRLSPAIDAGFIPFSAPSLGHTLCRKVDEAETGVKGYEVLVDSNNSMKDFYESDMQSLKDDKNKAL